MRERQLDARLETAIRLFPRVRTGADIGADHGYLTLALLNRGIADRMWTTDISASSLQKAQNLMEKNGLSARVRFGVGDGFKAVGEKVEAAAVLGMGGVNIKNILLQQAHLLCGCALVLSANTEMPSVRRTLMDLGYQIEDEALTEAGGHFYPVLLAKPGLKSAYSEKELTFGPVLLRRPADDVYRRYLQKKARDWENERGPAAEMKRQWIREEWERVQADGGADL